MVEIIINSQINIDIYPYGVYTANAVTEIFQTL